MTNSERIRSIQAQLDEDVNIAIIRENHNYEIKRIKAQLLADIAMEMVKKRPVAGTGTRRRTRSLACRIIIQ